MAQANLLITAATLTISLVAAAAPADAATRSNLYLRVGPGIHASVTMAGIHLSCSDDANCRFEVPPGSSFDVVADGGSGHSLRWSGCSAQPEPDRCRVEMRGEPVRITVR